MRQEKIKRNIIEKKLVIKINNFIHTYFFSRGNITYNIEYILVLILYIYIIMDNSELFNNLLDVPLKMIKKREVNLLFYHMLYERWKLISITMPRFLN